MTETMDLLNDSSNDWRKDWIEWNLRKTAVWGGKTLIRKKYSLSDGHTHCEFCWREFGSYGDDLLIGYNIKDTSVWICDECYDIFKPYFMWDIDKHE